MTLTLKGEGLVAGAEIVTAIPGTISRLAPSKELDTKESQLSFLVQLPATAPVGLYPVRVRTEDGLSNLLIFSVGDLPELFEMEPNDTLAEAQPIPVPVTINGNLKQADVDVFRLTGRARERLVFEVEARRMGSAIDPVLEVLDAAGRRLAFNDDAPGLGVDARLDVTFPRDGVYYVAVHDAKYSEQQTTFYRLKIGSYAYADGIFPLGGQRGKSIDVTFYGGNLSRPVETRVNLNLPPERKFVPVSLPAPGSAGSLPFQFLVGDLPEVFAPGDGTVARLEPSTVVNGRISRPGQVDRYRFKTAPGEKWLFSLVSASLATSELYGSLAVLDAYGKKLKALDVSGGADPSLILNVPQNVNEVTLVVDDVRGQGGPAYGYRLSATPRGEDFSLKILTPYVNIPAHGTAAVTVEAERRGYNGPIQLSIPDLPDDFTVEGGHVAAEILNYEGERERDTTGYLTITAKPDAKPRALKLSVWGEAVTIEGKPVAPAIRRHAEGPGLIFTVNGEDQYALTGDLISAKPVTEPWLDVELPVTVATTMPAVLQVEARNIRSVQGMEFSMDYKLTKQGPGIVTQGVGGLSLPSIKDLGLDGKAGPKGADEGKLVLSSTLDTPLVKFDVVPRATLQINGKEETVVAPAITVELVRAYSLAVDVERVELQAGGKTELTGKVRREPNFTGAVKISLRDPPEKVTCPAVEVPNAESSFRLVCEATNSAPEGDFEVHLVSSATIPGRTDKREYSNPPVAARMVVAAAKTTVASKPR